MSGTCAHVDGLDDASDVLVLHGDDERRAIERALRAVGLTWEQLEEQARHRDFSSLEAHDLWMAVGGVH